MAGASAAVLFLPYARVSRAQGLTRSNSEFRVFSARPASYLSPCDQNLYFGARQQQLLGRVLGKYAGSFQRPENALFAGFLPTILFFVGAVAALRGVRGRPADPWARGIALSGLLCFALSFAPVYVPLAKVVPGLSGMRVPARFYAFVSLTVVYFAARGADHLLRRVPGPRARAALAAGLAAVLIVELAPRRIDWVPFPREEKMPRAYFWLRDQPAVRAVVELPLYNNVKENEYLYASTVHWKPIANGTSGYTAESYRVLFSYLHTRLPRAGGFVLLREMGITHIVLHTDTTIRWPLLKRWEEQFGGEPGRRIEKVYEGEGIAIYRLLDPPPEEVGRGSGPVSAPRNMEGIQLSKNGKPCPEVYGKHLGP